MEREMDSDDKFNTFIAYPAPSEMYAIYVNWI
jgi:hypothetical protein